MTTSSISLISSSIIIFIGLSGVATISLVFIPTKEKTRIVLSLAWIFRTNFPWESVETPVVVPLITTVTPGKGIPCLSFTVPDNFFCSSLASSLLITNTPFTSLNVKFVFSRSLLSTSLILSS